jgi:replicative DNA helicase
MSDRLPPYDENLEAAAIGAMLQSPKDSVAEFVATNRNATALFFDLRHQTIFATIARMSDADQHIDSVTLESVLRNQGKVEDAGGIAYLATLEDRAPSPLQLPSYAQELRGLFIRRALIATGAEIVHRGYDGENPELALDECESRLLAIRAEAETAPDSDMRTLVRASIDEIEAAQANPGTIRGIPTGFPDLDRKLRGLKPGQMIVIAARPAQGNTSLALNIVEHVAADQKIPTGFVSLEMDKGELTMRLLCSRAGVPSDHADALNESEMRSMVLASSAISKAPLHICDQGGLTIPQLRAKARRMVQRFKVQLLIVDYLGLITSRAKNRYEQVSEISTALKTLARELRIPIIVLAQLNRDQDRDGNRRPRLSDLRDSGSIEQDADVCLFIHHADEKSSSLNIEKHRNGPTGTVPIVFKREITRFEKPPVD